MRCLDAFVARFLAETTKRVSSEWAHKIGEENGLAELIVEKWVRQFKCMFLHGLKWPSSTTSPKNFETLYMQITTEVASYPLACITLANIFI